MFFLSLFIHSVMGSFKERCTRLWEYYGPRMYLARFRDYPFPVYAVYYSTNVYVYLGETFPS